MFREHKLKLDKNIKDRGKASKIAKLTIAQHEENFARKIVSLKIGLLGYIGNYFS